MLKSFRPKLLHAEFVSCCSPKGRDKLSRGCRAKVVEWRWAGGDMAFAYRHPFVKERHCTNPAWLKAGTKPEPGNLRHGLDAQGLIHVVEDLQFEDILDERQVVPSYIVHTSNAVESAWYRAQEKMKRWKHKVDSGEP